MPHNTTLLLSARIAIFFAIYRAARKLKKTKFQALKEAFNTKDRRKK